MTLPTPLLLSVELTKDEARSRIRLALSLRLGRIDLRAELSLPLGLGASEI